MSAAQASSLARSIRSAARPRRHATSAAISAPAIRKRAETAKKAGIVSPATLIPR